MEEKRTGKEQPCNLILESRGKLSVSGVVDVDSFDEEAMVLITNLGALCVKGVDLHILKLNIDIGELVIEGEIDSMTYSDSYGGKSKGSLLARIFK